MLLGDPEYFVADINCEFSLHPYLNGRPTKAQLTETLIKDAMQTNPYKAEREYYNRFDLDGGEDVFVKRSTINKYAQTFYPVYENDGTKKFIIAYDPSSKVDNSVIGVAELFRDPDKGLMVKMVNCEALGERLKNGTYMVMQKPQQIERLKEIILDYNKGALDYENIDRLIIDSGAGGGGSDIAQFLVNEWRGKDGMMHLGLIDLKDPYMSLIADDHPGNSENLTMFNFKRDKNQAYERAQAAINQGLVIFPTDLNVRHEMEVIETLPDGQVATRYEKVTLQEEASLTQLSLMKEELSSMQKIKKPNGSVVFELSNAAKQRNGHDDRSDVAAMILDRLMELRAQEALALEEKSNDDFKEMFGKLKGRESKSNNPFGNMSGNPFARYKGKI